MTTVTPEGIELRYVMPRDALPMPEDAVVDRIGHWREDVGR